MEVPGWIRQSLVAHLLRTVFHGLIECLLNHGIRLLSIIVILNIYPLEEYNIRKDECTRYAQSLGLDIVDADYDHAFWRCTVAGLENEPERGGRCLKCFKMRLADTAVMHMNTVSQSSRPR